MRTHWSVKYIGKRHVIGGRGPEEFDCWGLLYWIYLYEFGIDLPELVGAAPGDCREISKVVIPAWKEVENPFDGCGVAMGRELAIHHVGVYASVDHGKVIHCWRTNTVGADTLREMRFAGLRTIKFYQHKEWPT